MTSIERTFCKCATRARAYAGYGVTRLHYIMHKIMHDVKCTPEKKIELLTSTLIFNSKLTEITR